MVEYCISKKTMKKFERHKDVYLSDILDKKLEIYDNPINLINEDYLEKMKKTINIEEIYRKGQKVAER